MPGKWQAGGCLQRLKGRQATIHKAFQFSVKTESIGQPFRRGIGSSHDAAPRVNDGSNGFTRCPQTLLPNWQGLAPLFHSVSKVLGHQGRKKLIETRILALIFCADFSG